MRNLNTALRRFNRMYEDVSADSKVSADRLCIVYNYGQNMMNLYKKADLFDEVESKLRAISSLVNCKKLANL